MKKYLYILVHFGLSSGYLYGYTMMENNGKEFYGSCNNGQNFSGNYLDNNSFSICGPNGCTSGTSLSAKITKICKGKKYSKKKTILNIKKKSLIFSKRIGDYSIENGLMDKFNFRIMKLAASIGHKSIFSINKNQRVYLLRYYPPHKIMASKKGDIYISSHNIHKYNKSNIKEVMMTEGYYKIKDSSGSIYYVRESDTF